MASHHAPRASGPGAPTVTRLGAALVLASLAVTVPAGRADAQTVQAISISAASVLQGTPLYPGGAGDVIAEITNPNGFTVTIDGVQPPPQRTFAAGYTTTDLSTPQPGCDPATSAVSWSHAGDTSRMHALAAPVTLGPYGTLLVTFAGGAVMGLTSPSACAGTYFLMPALVAVAARQGSGPATPGPAKDWWSDELLAGWTPVPPGAPSGSPSGSARHGAGLAAPSSSPGSGPTARLRAASGWLAQQLKQLALDTRLVAQATAFTFLLLPFIVLFLLIQRRIDRNDPKLALAPAYSDPELPFVDLDQDR